MEGHRATVVITEVTRPSDADPHAWLPFPEGHQRYTDGWWDDAYRFHLSEDSRWFVAREDGVEVGRVEVDVTTGDGYYVGAAVLGDMPILDIEFIDVAMDHRRRGVATAIVGHLIATFAGHRLVAFSEEADAFWSSLKWARIEHPKGTTHYRPLYVQPL